MSADFRKVRNLIASAQLDEALEALQAASEGLPSSLENTLLLLRGQYSRLKRESLNGLLTAEQQSLQTNQFINRLLMAIEEWERLAPASPTSSSPAAPPQPEAGGPDSILFLGASPKDTPPVDLDREVRVIQQGLERSKHRDAFRFATRTAARPADVRQALSEQERPPRFIHFAGHAALGHPQYGSGLLFEDEQGNAKSVDVTVFADLLSLFPGVECILFNACHSQEAARAASSHLKYSIGIAGLISDAAALAFAVGFYDAVAAGRDVPFAFKLAKNNIALEGHEGGELPVLFEKK
jgi:hypothetical protein